MNFTYLIKYKGEYYPTVRLAAKMAGLEPTRFQKVVRKAAVESKSNTFKLEYKEEIFFITKFNN